MDNWTDILDSKLQDKSTCLDFAEDFSVDSFIS